MRWLFPMLTLLYLLWGCSSDEDRATSGQQQRIPNIDVIGQDLQAQYWYRFNGSDATGTMVDLSETSGFRSDYLVARQVGSMVNFFTFSEGAFSVFRLDLLTGTTAWIRDLYQVTSDRSVIWGAATESEFLLGNYSPRSTTNYEYLVLASPGSQGSHHPVATQVQQVYDPLYAEGRLYLCYRDAGGEYRLAVIKTLERDLQQVLNFGRDTPSFFLDASGHLAVILGSGEDGNRLLRYVPETMQLADERELKISRFFPPGPLEAKLGGELLYYAYDFAQPSAVVFGPAIFDLLSSENRVVDMASIVGEVQETLKRSIVLGEWKFFETEEVFVVGYYIDRPEPVLEGGLLLINVKGELVQRVDLPFSPTFIVDPIQ